MKILLDFRMKPIFLNYFLDMRAEIVKVLGSSGIYDEVLGHPDIYCTSINGKVIMASNICTDKSLSNAHVYGENVENFYPNDIKYNICVTKKYAICNHKYIARKVKEEIIRQNLEVINVKQGYAKCNLIALNDENYITSDIGVKNALESKGFNVLYIDSKNIRLLNKDGSYSKMQGFIGGATAILGKNVILFGDVSKLGNSQAFKNFIKSNGYKLVDFKDEEIIDYGGIIVI